MLVGILLTVRSFGVINQSYKFTLKESVFPCLGHKRKSCRGLPVSHVDGIMALRQLFPLFRCPFIRICLSLYYPRRSSVHHILMISPLSDHGRRLSMSSWPVFPRLCEDIGNVFFRIDLIQPRRPYDRHEGPGGLGSLLRIAEKEVLPCHHGVFHRPFGVLCRIEDKFVNVKL